MERRGGRDGDEVDADVGSVCDRVRCCCGVNGEVEVVETGVVVVEVEVGEDKLVVLRRGELSSREAMEGIVLVQMFYGIVWLVVEGRLGCRLSLAGGASCAVFWVMEETKDWTAMMMRRIRKCERSN